MIIDDKAKLYLKKAKDTGISREDAFSVLQSKGYDLGQPKVENQEAQLAQERLTTLQKEAKQIPQSNWFERNIAPTIGKTARTLTGAESPEEFTEKVQPKMYGFGQGMSMGFADNLMDKLGIADGDEVRKDIDASFKEDPLGYLAGDIIGSIVGMGKFGKAIQGTKLGAKAIAKASPYAIGGFVGGVTAAGESDLNPLSTTIGTLAGAVSPVLSKQVVKGVEKLGSPFRKMVNKITTETKPKTLMKIAPLKQDADVLISGINASKKISSKLSGRVEKGIRDTNKRVNKSILKEFGVNSPDELMTQSKKEFSEWSNWAKDKFIPMNKVKGLMNSKIISREAIKMKANNPAKWSKVSDNNMGFLQELKSKIASKSRKGGVDADDFKDAKNLITDFIDTNSAGFKEKNKRYAISKGKERLADTMMKGKARVGSNVASLLDKPDVYKEVSDEFGEDVAKRVEKTVINQMEISNGLKRIKTAIDKKTSKSFSDRLRSPKELTMLGLGAYGVANPAVGLAGLGAIKGADVYSASKAGELLMGSKTLDPFVQAILAKQAGKVGTDPRVQDTGDLLEAVNPFSISKMIGGR